MRAFLPEPKPVEYIRTWIQPTLYEIAVKVVILTQRFINLEMPVFVRSLDQVEQRWAWLILTWGKICPQTLAESCRLTKIHFQGKVIVGHLRFRLRTYEGRINPYGSGVNDVEPVCIYTVCTQNYVRGVLEKIVDKIIPFLARLLYWWRCQDGGVTSHLRRRQNN